MVIIHVAAALLCNGNKKFLIAKRAHGHLVGKWEFPGGKIDEGETKNETVIREIREELGVTIVPEEIVGIFRHVYGERDIELTLIRCSFPCVDEKLISDGSHSEHAWISLSECGNFDFAPLDEKIVEFLTKQR